MTIIYKAVIHLCESVTIHISQTQSSLTDKTNHTHVFTFLSNSEIYYKLFKFVKGYSDGNCRSNYLAVYLVL